MSDAVHELHPSKPRWTHIALRVGDIEATIAWYCDFTPLELLARNEDEAGMGAWLAMPGETENPFVLVVAQFFEGSDPFEFAPKAVLAPFAHLGMELTQREDIDAMADRGREAGCLAMEPTQMPAPVGYICMLTDPDGNTVEYSWDQGVYSTAQKVWG